MSLTSPKPGKSSTRKGNATPSSLQGAALNDLRGQAGKLGPCIGDKTPGAETCDGVDNDCNGIVAPWFRELVVAEMNYFAELVELPFVKGDACVVSIGTDRSLTPGRINIHLYVNQQRLNACVRNEQCPVFRSISLIPKDTVLYRSYFLSDMSRKLISQQCVTAKGKLYPDTTCYTVP